MSGTQAFVIALAGLIVGPLITILISRWTRRHERAMAWDERRFDTRKIAYLDVLVEARRQIYLLGQVQRHLAGEEVGDLPDYNPLDALTREAAAGAFSSQAFVVASDRFRDGLNTAWVIPPAPDDENAWEERPEPVRVAVLEELAAAIGRLEPLLGELEAQARIDLTGLNVS